MSCLPPATTCQSNIERGASVNQSQEAAVKAGSADIPLYLELWMQPEHRLFGLVFLSVLLAHGLAIGCIELKMPRPIHTAPPKAGVFFLPCEGQSSFDPYLCHLFFQINHEDPSALAIPSTDSLSTDFSALDFHGSAFAPGEIQPLLPSPSVAEEKASDMQSLAKKMLREKNRPSVENPVALSGNESPAVSSEFITVSSTLVSRAPNPLPVPPVCTTERPLRSPTALEIAIDSTGMVAYVIPETSSGNTLADTQAVQMVKRMRFASDERESLVWGTIFFNWQQQAPNLETATPKP